MSRACPFQACPRVAPGPGLSNTQCPRGRISLSSEIQVENAPGRPLSLPVGSQGGSSYSAGLGAVGLGRDAWPFCPGYLVLSSHA